jgi:hypothetical protein
MPRPQNTGKRENIEKNEENTQKPTKQHWRKDAE